MIVFAGGGTGGHLYPGLAVIEALKAETGNSEAQDYLWIGNAKGMDRGIVEAAGVRFRGIPAGKLRREPSLKNLIDVFKVMAGVVASFVILAKNRPSLVFSKGGYVSVPPVFAARLLKIPVCTHESDVTPGLATRINARSARTIFLSYERTRAELPDKYRSISVVAGNPVRAAIFSGSRERGRAILGVEPALPVVFVIGGSQGARQINELVDAIIGELAKDACVVHQTGENNLGASYSSPRYVRKPYLRDELPDILAAADVVVTRSGAGTLWECAALGKPTILVPLAGSGTRGDQVINAEVFERAGASRVLVGSDATPERLLAELRALLGDARLRGDMGARAKSLCPSNPSTLIARELIGRGYTAGRRE